MKQKLSVKQERFVAAYLACDFNATEAARQAGYEPSRADVTGFELLQKPHIKAAIAKHTKKTLDKLDLSTERTLEYVARLAFFDPIDLFEDDGSLKLLKDMPPAARSVIAGLEVTELFDGATGEQKHAIGLIKKLKLTDRQGALDKLMRYHALYKDKVELTGLESLADAISKARKRRDEC